MTARFVEVICNFDQVVPDIGRRKNPSLTMVSKTNTNGEMTGERCLLGGSPLSPGYNEYIKHETLPNIAYKSF